MGAPVKARLKPKARFILWRHITLLLACATIGFAVLARTVYLQVVNQDFLNDQGDMRALRTLKLEALRGIIMDRNGEPMAVSTPVDSIWFNAKIIEPITNAQMKKLSAALDMSAVQIKQKIRESQGREFVYLKRQLEPSKAQDILALKIPGINAQREYRRYYPAGEAAAHVIGLVNVDGNGVEGVELAFNDYLKGKEGSKRVLKDRRGHTLQDIALIKNAEEGHPLQLSIDSRLQYLTYRELKNAVNQHHAKAGSAVILDVKTGEILAMVNQPSYNPNNRAAISPESLRNRVVTDVFEPGSVVKPFSVFAALDNGSFQPQSKIETAPGYMVVNGNTIRDIHNYGELTLTGVLRKSSNVGTAKIVLTLPERAVLDTYQHVGFGTLTSVEYPGERGGYLELDKKLDPFSRATLSFGYGLSTTSLQIARAYAAIANQGQLPTITLLKRDVPLPPTQALTPASSATLARMLEINKDDGGSGQSGRVLGYHVAGKSGTARKLGAAGYEADRHISSFVGFAPMSNPRLVCLVVLDEPTEGGYYGGAVSAPVFGNIMRGSLRILDIPLDDETAYHGVVLNHGPAKQ